MTILNYDRDYKWIETDHANSLRVIPLRHRGWFVDNTQDTASRGVIVRLTGGRFLAGCYDPWQDGRILVSREVFHDAATAARLAYQIAE